MDNIKIGSIAWGLPGGGEYATKVAHSLGLAGLQLDLGSHDFGYQLKEKLVMQGYLEDKERYSLEYPTIIVNDVMYNVFINGRDTNQGKIAYYQIELAIEIAAEMEIPTVMIPNFEEALITEEEHIENTRKALKFACERAKGTDVLILTETGLLPDAQFKMMDDINEDNLLIHFDTQNYYYNHGYDQCEVLEQLYPRIYNIIHTKDGIDGPGDRLLGDGDTDFFKQMEIFKEKQYSGWIILENYYNQFSLRKNYPGLSAMDLVKKDIATLKSSLSI